jgi:hypothetical protein
MEKIDRRVMFFLAEGSTDLQAKVNSEVAFGVSTMLGETMFAHDQLQSFALPRSVNCSPVKMSVESMPYNADLC